MDKDLFLQQLRDLNLEEGRAYIQAHSAELSDHAACGNLLAEVALDQLYTPFVSLKLAELLIFFGEYVSHTPSYALGLKAKGDALMLIGHLQASMACLDNAGEEFLRLGDEGNWARSRISWIVSAAWLGSVEEALREAVRARDVFLRLGEVYWVCVLDHNTALIYEYIGRYQQALKLYESMQITYPTLTDQSESSIKRSIGLAEMNQANNLIWLGNFEQAYRLQQQARASFIALGETGLFINTEINLADLDYVQGYYGSALRRYYQARDSLIQSNINNPLLLAELKLCMANCLVKLNRAQEACLLANEAVKIYQQSGISLSRGNALREYATVLVASGRLKEALAALNEASILLNRGKFDPYVSAVKLQQAEILLEMGSVAMAYDQASVVKNYSDTQGVVVRSVRATWVMVSALIKNAQQVDQEKERKSVLLYEAMLLCKDANLRSRQYNLQEEIYKSYYLLGRIFALQENLTQAARHYSAAIAQIERILGDLVYDLSPSFMHSTWSVYEDMIALCLQQSQVERAFGYLEQARSMALRQYLNKSKPTPNRGVEQEDITFISTSQKNNATVLRTQYELRDEQEKHRYYSLLLADIDPSVSPTIDQEVIHQELKRCEEKISDLSERLYLYQSEMPVKSYTKKTTRSHIKHISITQLCRQLAPDQLMLVYFLYKEKVIIFVATREGVVSHEVPDGVEQLGRLLPLLHAHLQPSGWPNIQHPPQQVIRRLLNKLYNLLIAPVSHLLPQQVSSLTIVPYGPLHKLPFHALHDGSHFLIEDYQINYLPASNMLIHLANRKDEQTIYSTEASITSKRPLVFGYSGNGHLQGTLDEAKVLAALLNGYCYLESEATIARLIEQAPGSPIIHIATHGHSRLDAPNFSYVLLSDGQLNAIDAFSLDLNRCELVTLSGCETGLALSSGGDEQLGLGRAFLAAGTKSLLMSLWPVEDNATNELMRCFYHHLLEGESKGQALRAAQCSLLHRTGSIYTHPYFWAAFRLVGDVGPLKDTRAKDASLALAADPLKK